MSFSVSLSGLQAAQLKMDVTANNTANVLSAGFKKSRTVNLANSAQVGGVRAEIQQVDAQGISGPVDPATGEPIEPSNVDLAEEMVNMIVSGRTFKANLQTLRTEDAMLGHIIDVIA